MKSERNQETSGDFRRFVSPGDIIHAKSRDRIRVRILTGGVGWIGTTVPPGIWSVRRVERHSIDVECPATNADIERITPSLEGAGDPLTREILRRLVARVKAADAVLRRISEFGREHVDVVELWSHYIDACNGRPGT